MGFLARAGQYTAEERAVHRGQSGLVKKFLKDASGWWYQGATWNIAGIIKKGIPEVGGPQKDIHEDCPWNKPSSYWGTHILGNLYMGMNASLLKELQWRRTNIVL